MEVEQSEGILRGMTAETAQRKGRALLGRGLHSSTFRLNVSAFCGIGVAIRGCPGAVQGVLGLIMGCLGCMSEAAEVELKNRRG